MVHADRMMQSGSPRNKLAVEIGFQTDQGRRAANEDFAGCLGACAALADGVGGAKGGRVAAELAVRGFLDGYDSLDPIRGVKRNAIAALEAMNAWVHAQGIADPMLEGMACTFTALILRGRQAHAIHVGDSRLYRLRDDTLVRLTNDHVLTRGAVRNILTRALGAEPDIRVDYTVEPAREHDR
jgi:serine/threonine protein phosphatase PrpC